MLRRMLVIVLVALTGSACSSSREAVRGERLQATAYSLQDSVKEEVMVAVHDTIMEVTTITIRENELGDTLRVSTVTDRMRGRSRDAIAVQRTKTEVKVDTVYVERRDSVEIRSRPSAGGGQSGGTALHTTLRLIIWIIIGLIGLVIVVKIRGRP